MVNISESSSISGFYLCLNQDFDRRDSTSKRFAADMVDTLLFLSFASLGNDGPGRVLGYLFVDYVSMSRRGEL